MTIGIRPYNPQDPDDTSNDTNVFAQNYTDPFDATGNQDSLVDAAAITPRPAVAPPILTQTLYLTEPSTTTPISVTDINQGQLGDCFLLSPIGEEALFHPTSITNMIHLNSNGTETVTLYTDQNGRLPTFATTKFKATTVTINNTFSTASVDNGSTQDVVGNQKEIWPQVLEKAVATLDGGYNAIAYGGYPVLAMEELTGHAASFMAPANLTLAALLQYVSAGDLITMDTASAGGLGYGLVGDHCYMFDKVTGSGVSASIQLLNPWGFDQPAAIPLARLAQSGVVEVDIGHVS
jgi:hypothetical protein